MRRRMIAPEAKEFEERVIGIDRVARVVKGGRRFRFRAVVVVGDRKGQLGMGVAKAGDVTSAISKAVTQAKKIMIKPYIINGTLPYECKEKFKSAVVMIRPGKHGRGIIAGGVVRTMLELAGYKDVVAKMIGSKNKINNVKAVYNIFNKLN